MNTKIIFFDIDGTLTDEETNTVPLSCINAIHEVQNNGHIAIVNTGRPVSTIEKMITDIHFDGYICGCGTYIKYKNEVILHATLDEIIRQEVIRQVYLCNVQAVLEGEKGAFFSNNLRDPYVIAFKQHYIDEGLPTGEYNEHDLIDFDKMAVWYDESSDIETFRNYLKQYFEIIQRADHFIEVVPLGYSKASGISYLINHLNIDIDDTLSIGDSTNDLSMLNYTNISIAMGNSNPILFDKVTYVTDSAKDDGIYNALKHYELIK